MSESTPTYPAWICMECGRRYGRRRPICYTVHVGDCGVCGRTTEVTEPRDFGHLRDEWKQHVTASETAGGSQ